jgi:hypothetical protein
VYTTALLVFLGIQPTRADTQGVLVNGSCIAGSCPPTSALPFSSTATLPFSFDLTLPNLDTFEVVGSTSMANNSNGTGYNFGLLPFNI